MKLFILLASCYFERACANLLWMWRWFLERRLICSISSLCATWWLICRPKSSANSPHVQKCGSSEILKHVADSRKSSRHMCPLWKLKWLLLLRKPGRNSRQVCWRQQRKCAAQQSPIDGDVKLGSGIRRWMMPSQPSAKLSKHGRLANAHEHHIALPSASPEVWCTMHATKQTRWSMRVLTTSRLIFSALPTRWGKRMLML